MPSLSTSLPQLRETLASLESYELPEKYKQIAPTSSSPLSSSVSSPSSPSSPSSQPIVDPKLFQRYLKAKDAYLRKRMNHLFIQHLSSIQYSTTNKENEFQNTSNSSNSNNQSTPSSVQITLPEKPTQDEIQELNTYKQRVTCELLNNMQNIRSCYDGVHSNYKLLNDKKDDIKNIIMTLEQQQQKRKGKNLQGEEENQKNVIGNNNNDDAEDEDENELDSSINTIQESELELEEERLQTLRQRKSMLEVKLHKLQMEKELVKNNIEKDQQLVKELIAARNSGEGSSSSNNNDSSSIDGNNNITGNGDNEKKASSGTSFDIGALPSIEEIKSETQKLHDQAQTYQDMTEYYDSIKCAMEVIGGMKILSITSIGAKKNISHGVTSSNKNNNEHSVGNIDSDVIMSSPYSSPSTSPTKENKKGVHNNSSSNSSGGSQKKATSSLKKLSPPSQNRQSRQNRQLRHQTSSLKNSDSINLKVLLLDYHIVSLILTANISCASPSPSTSSSAQQQLQQPVLNYRVSSAQFETPTTISDTMHEDNNGNGGPSSSSSSVISMTIPPLDDLVTLSNNLKPLHDIQFILREAMSRIRIISQRVDELAQLRLKYLTKITNPMKNKIKFGYGGEYQEIVCSLSCQVTVVLRLTCDCPVLDGSAYIHQIVGVSGWDSQCLERMKKKVNTKKWRSPIQVMDSLEEEIRRVVKDEGVCLPKTPSFPMRKKK